MRRNKDARPVWRVIITPAKREGNYEWDYGKYKTHPEPGVIAIRIQCDGQDRMTYSTLNISDEDFEEKITTLKAEAEEKAATLQAVGVVV